MLSFTILMSCQFILSMGFKDCNFTDFRFQSKYNLGKQDELNNTFDSMEPKMKISDIIYPVNSYTNYSFTEIKTSFSYFDSNQKALILGNDTILIDGGYLSASLQMNWKKKDFFEKTGTIKARCNSDDIMFTKNLTTDKGYLLYMVEQYFNLTFDSPCLIVRYDPANISQLDMGFIQQLLNKRDDGKQTLKSSLKEAINAKYYYELNNSLYNEKHQLDEKFIYQWTDKFNNKNLSVQYQVLPTGVDVQKIGISFTFITEIKDYLNWECGATIPHDNLDIQTYGGIQQFVSLSVFKNTLKYGIQAGILDSRLERSSWESRMFQFYAGDLYEVMPYISQTYYARQQIAGSCKGIPSNLSITAQQAINQLLVQTSHACSLFIKNTTKILDLKIDLFSQIEVSFQQQAKVNFYVKNFTHNLSFLEQPLFHIQNYQLGNSIVLSCLNKMLNMKTFGSGWPIFKMDLPELKVMAQGYVVFYDKSHFGSKYEKRL